MPARCSGRSADRARESAPCSLTGRRTFDKAKGWGGNHAWSALVDMDPETGKLQLAGGLPATGSGIPGIRFDRDDWLHGRTGPAFAHGAVFSTVQ